MLKFRVYSLHSIYFYPLDIHLSNPLCLWSDLEEVTDKGHKLRAKEIMKSVIRFRNVIRTLTRDRLEHNNMLRVTISFLYYIYYQKILPQNDQRMKEVVKERNKERIYLRSRWNLFPLILFSLSHTVMQILTKIN